MKGKIDVFCKSIEPDDIAQGDLGDCWYLSALSSLAERPYLVQRLFITQNYNDEGIYRLKLCKNGEWVEVTVDDYIPCYPHNGGPAFSKAHGNELWAMLLEKAYAKLHGCYTALRLGMPYDAYVDLTGCATLSFNFEDVAEEIQSGAFFRKLVEYDRLQYLIAGCTKGVDNLTEGGKPGAKDGGIVPGHAYSII